MEPAEFALPIRTQIQKGKTHIQIEWLMNCAAACGQWL